MTAIHSDHPADTIKMIRETFCVAQVHLGRSDDYRKREHLDRLQRLIDDCDQQRPLGHDGKHGSLHTPTCGMRRIDAPTDSTSD